MGRGCLFGFYKNKYSKITGRLRPPFSRTLLLHGRGRRRGGLLVAKLKVGAHLVVDVAIRGHAIPLAVAAAVGLVEDGAGAPGRTDHPEGGRNYFK